MAEKGKTPQEITIVPHYVGDEDTRREALLVIRRILLKYRSLPKLPDGKDGTAGNG